MTIVFYTHQTAGKKKSSASLFYRLFVAASQNFPDHQFLVVAPASEKNSIPLNKNSTFIALPATALNRLTGFFWRRLSLTIFLNKTKPDAVVHTNSEIISLLNYPQFFLIATNNPSIETAALPYLSSLSTFFKKDRNKKNSLSLIVPSAQLQNILKNKLPQIENCSFVVHPFPEKTFEKQEEAKREEQKKIVAEGCEYFFCPDALQTKENLLTLLKAFSFFKKRLKSNMKLVLTGNEADYKINAATLLDSYRFKKEVFFYTETEINPRADLLSSSFLAVYFMNEASALLNQPEALQCELPCIVADSPYSRETGENTCLYYKAGDHQDLSQKLILLYNDETLRNNLIIEAEKRKIFYSENYAINQLWKAISSVADNE